MWTAIISGIIAIAGIITSAAISSSETDKQSKKAKMLGDKAALDQMNRDMMGNELAEQQLKIGKERLGIKRDEIAEEEKGRQESMLEIKDAQKTENTQSASRLFAPTEDILGLKQNKINRWGI